MRTLLRMLPLLVLFCVTATATYGADDHEKDAETQKAALGQGKGSDLPAIKSCDRIEIVLEKTAPDQSLPKKANITDADDLKKITDAMKISEVEPSAGEIAMTLRCFKGPKMLRQVWVYGDGEWGVVRLNTPSWTLGKNAELATALADLLKANGKK